MIPEEMSLIWRLKGLWLGLKVRARFSLGKRLPARKPRKSEIIGGKAFYTCPRCGDFVYYPKQCVSCGQRFSESVMTIGEVIDYDTGT